MATSAELELIFRARNEAKAAVADFKGDIDDIKTSTDSLAKTQGFNTMIEGVARASSALGSAREKLSTYTQAASGLGEAQSKVNVVFGDGADDVMKWADNAAEAFGQSERQALSAAGTYGNLFRAFGIGTEKSQEMSTSLVELAADLASFNDTNIDEALTALQSGLSGETEPLKRFGVALNESRIQAEAMALGLVDVEYDTIAVQQAVQKADEAYNKHNATVKKYGEESNEAEKSGLALAAAEEKLAKLMEGTPAKLDAAAKSQAVYSLIMKDTALAQGDYARTSDGLANTQRSLQAAQEDMAASVGAVVVPAQLALINTFLGLPGPMQQGIGLFQTFGGDAIGLAAGLGQATMGVSAIGPAIGGALPMLAAARTAIMAMGAAMLTPPMGFVVALVAAGVAIYVFRDEIMAGLGAAKDFAVGAVGEARDFIVGAFDTVMGFARDNWPEIAVLISGPFAPLVLLATDAFGVRSAITEAFTAILDWLRGLPDWFMSAGEAIGNGLKNGIMGAIRSIPGEAAGILGSIPGVGTGLGIAGSVGDALGFDTGGIVPGPIGAPRLAVVHGGETILPTHRTGGGSGGNGTNVTVNVQSLTIADPRSGMGAIGDLGFSLAEALRSRGVA